MDVIWSVLILNVQDIPLHLRTLLKAKRRPNLRQIHDHSFPRDIVNQVNGGDLLLCSRGSPVMDDIYGLVAQTQRCSFHRLHPERGESSARQTGPARFTDKDGGTWMSLTRCSTDDQHPICWGIMSGAAPALAPASQLPSPAPPASLRLGLTVALCAHVARAGGYVI